MDLPFNSEYPMVPFVNYSGNAPPFIPSVSVFEELNPYIPFIAVAVANEATRMASSSRLRMFCYNMLSFNNWQNDTYAELVSLSVNYLHSRVLKREYHNHKDGIQPAVSAVMTLWASSVLFQYPRLKEVTTGKAIDAAMRNVPIFNNLKQEINVMYRNQGYPQNAPPPNNWQAQPPGYGYPQQGGYPPPGYPQQPPPGYGYPPQQYQQPPQQQWQQPRYQPPPQPQQQRWVGAAPQVPQGPQGGQWSTPSPVTQEPPMPSSLSQSQYFAKPAPRPAPPAKTFDTPVDFVDVLPVEPKVSTTKGSVAMKNDKELSLFGIELDINIKERYQALRTSASILSTVHTVYEDRPQHYLSMAMSISGNFEECVSAMQTEKLQKQGRVASSNVYRCFSTAINLILSSEEIAAYHARLKTASDFKSLAGILVTLQRSLAKAGGESNENAAVSAYLSQIDRMLTKQLNDYNIRIMDFQTTIDSFAMDVADLIDNYMYPAYSHTAMKVFKEYEAAVMQGLFAGITDDDIKDYAAFNDIVPPVYHVACPVQYSFTDIGMMELEMEVLFEKGSGSINEENAPILHKLACSLDSHKEYLDVQTSCDVFVTSDDVRFQVVKSPYIDGEFLMARI